MQRISNKLLKILKKQSNITWFAFWKDNSLRSEWIMTIAFLRTSVHILPAHSRGHLQIMSLCPEDSPHTLPGSSLWPRTFFGLHIWGRPRTNVGQESVQKYPSFLFTLVGQLGGVYRPFFQKISSVIEPQFPTAVNYSLTLA